MTLEQLQSNEELRGREFPVVRQKIYVAHAGVCPIPRRVQQAIAQYTEVSTTADQESVLPSTWLRETRQLTANFLRVKIGEIAFVGPTSVALSCVAEGLSFRRHENVLIYHDDYPSNVYPWMTLADRGVQVRYLNTREYGCIRARDVIGQVDENTRLVALASCHFLAGYRLDLEVIGKFLRSRGIFFCVDAIQTLGAFPTPLSYVDFAAADAHKWLLGPCAAGVLYVRQEVQDQMRPTAHGWHNIRNPNFVAQDELTYQPDARRYEAGSHNLLGLAGMRAGLELLNEIGVEKIARDLFRKRAWLAAALQEKGYSTLNSAASPENSGPMISFFKPGAEMRELNALLEKNSIVASLRADRSNRTYLRLSPHFYNTDQELQQVLDFL